MGYAEIYELVKQGGLLALVVLEGLAIRWLYMNNSKERLDKEAGINTLIETRHNEYVLMLTEFAKLQEATLNTLRQVAKLLDRVDRALENIE